MAGNGRRGYAVRSLRAVSPLKYESRETTHSSARFGDGQADELRETPEDRSTNSVS